MTNLFWEMGGGGLTRVRLKILNLALIIVISFAPLFVKFPFYINIFLAWEGAYRISLGQIPSIDFYLPMGFVFWLLPALFFKIFGANLFTLIIFQCFVNLFTFFAFWKILNQLRVNFRVISLSLLVLGVSYVVLNFWPWYNNFVVLMQLVSIIFFLKSRQVNNIARYTYLFFAACFSVLSFFTKQDAGGLTIVLNLSLVLYTSVKNKNLIEIVLFIVFLVVWMIPFVWPFLNHDFLYWFNYGQAPHYSRLNMVTYLDQIMMNSIWVKFYLFIIIMLLLVKYQKFKDIISSERDFIFLILTLGILFQASVIQVTSYIPPYTHLYLHSFAFAYILEQISTTKEFQKTSSFFLISGLILFLLSANIWKYGRRLAKTVFPVSYFETRQDVISKNTWLNAENSIYDSTGSWKLSDLESFKNIYMPQETVEGLDRLVSRYKGKGDLKVLNMSELTPLAIEIGYKPLTNQPLWFHKNVSIFDKDLKEICINIKEHKYDVVIFESIPVLNNFYPEEVYNYLTMYYNKVDEFRAPRREKNSQILVFEKY
jgi:hypothetical protein